MLNSLNFVLLGDFGIAAQLGKKGTATDIVIYDRKTLDTIYTWTSPTTFPDKIASLMQAINIAEYAILNVTKLDKFLGEQIMALDLVGIKEGFVLHSYDVDREKVNTLLKRTTIANYAVVDSVEDLKHEMTKLRPMSAQGPIMIQVDHAFDVKGAGAVVLGVIKQGSVKAYDELMLLPENKKILVKSIQMHDDPVEIASSPARVGLAVKGVSANEISRGDVICEPDSVKVSTGSFTAKFSKSSFFKGNLAENQGYMISVGMQVKAARAKFEGEIVQVSPEKPLAYKQGQTLVVLKPDSQGTRIVGKGSIE